VLEWAIAFARLLQFGGALVLFGLALFCIYGFRKNTRNSPASPGNWARSGILIAAIGALAGAWLWVGAQAATFFPDAGFFDPAAHWIVLAETGFGRIAFLREGLLVASIAVALLVSPAKLFWVAQTLLGGVAVASFAWVGHGIYDSGFSGILHTGADVLHLLAAGVWIGALVPLCILIVRSLRTQTERDAYAALDGLERFSGIGPAAVSILLATGLINSWFLVGIAQWRALFATDYGIALTIKLILFAVMLMLAAANRYRLSPQLRASLEKGLSPAVALRTLRSSVAMELVLSIAVLAAVALLGTWEPPVAG
jgi:putative copper resistance protein D